MTGLAAIQRYIDEQKIDKSKAGWKNKLPKPPADASFAGAKVTWKLATNVGDIAIALMPEVAPRHVASTVYLTQLGFYDDVPFHRVIPGFMAQGGDPTGRGTGGPGYQYAGEFDPEASSTTRADCSAWPTPGPTPTAASSSSRSWRRRGSTASTRSSARSSSGMDTLKKLERRARRAVSRPRRSRS